MKVIIDENLHHLFIERLRSHDIELLQISENSAGISDEEVIEVVKKTGGILVTEDKDFGALVVAHKVAKVTVAFLRYRKPELEKMATLLLEVVKEYMEKEGEYFITITSTRIRIRKL